MPPYPLAPSAILLPLPPSIFSTPLSDMLFWLWSPYISMFHVRRVSFLIHTTQIFSRSRRKISSWIWLFNLGYELDFSLMIKESWKCLCKSWKYIIFLINKHRLWKIAPDTFISFSWESFIYNLRIFCTIDLNFTWYERSIKK